MTIPQKQFTVANPEADSRMKAMEQALRDAGTPFKRIEGDRTVERQVYLYSLGRTIPGPRVDLEHPMGRTVTRCDGIKKLSNHQHGCAADYWPLTPFGSVFCPADTDNLWEVLADAAEAQGLSSGLRWEDRDADHVEWLG